jgi:hypothetical protein
MRQESAAQAHGFHDTHLLSGRSFAHVQQSLLSVVQFFFVPLLLLLSQVLFFDESFDL